MKSIFLINRNSYHIKLYSINGLKQKEIDTDFTLIPTLVVSRPATKHQTILSPWSFSFGIEWGHWQAGFFVAIVKKQFRKKPQQINLNAKS